MYLRATCYVSGYNFEENEKKAGYALLVQLFQMEKFVDPHTPSGEVQFTVAYWRKANAIHQWFVDNVQDGVDDCRNAYVPREKLIELRDLCQEVIDSLRVDDGSVHRGTSWDAQGQHEHYGHGQVVVNPEQAAELLPTQGGFFFGSTDYDEGYIADLHDTVTQINRALGLDTNWEFQYHSSW